MIRAIGQTGSKAHRPDDVGTWCAKENKRG